MIVNGEDRSLAEFTLIGLGMTSCARGDKDDVYFLTSFGLPTLHRFMRE